MTIYILTHNRTDQITYRGLPPELQEQVLFVVHPDNPVGGDQRLECPVQGQGAFAVRDFIMKHCTSPVVVMLDDDIQFKANHDGKFITATHGDISEGFSRMATRALEPDTLFTSLGTTFFNDGTESWSMNGRNSHSFFINRAIAEEYELTFLGIPTCEDTYFTLQGLVAGLKNYSYLDLCATSPTRQTGGEALDGDRGQRHEEAVRILMEKFPQFVRVKENKNKHHLDNIGTPIDTIVQWKKAYRHGVASR